MIGRFLDDGDVRKLHGDADQEEAARAIGATAGGHQTQGGYVMTRR
jgi:hypothetical protein